MGLQVLDFTTTGNGAYKKSVNGYIVGKTELSTINSVTSDSVVSGTIKEDLGNKKILVGVEIAVAYANVNATLVVQGSIKGGADVSGGSDDTGWVTLATASINTDPSNIGLKTYQADLSGIYAPYYRIHFNAGGLNLGISGKCYLYFATK